jgi:hypothetical protein
MLELELETKGMFGCQPTPTTPRNSVFRGGRNVRRELWRDAQRCGSLRRGTKQALTLTLTLLEYQIGPLSHVAPILKVVRMKLPWKLTFHCLMFPNPTYKIAIKVETTRWLPQRHRYDRCCPRVHTLLLPLPLIILLSATVCSASYIYAPL